MGTEELEHILSVMHAVLEGGKKHSSLQLV